MATIALASSSTYGQHNIEYEFPSQIYDKAESITIKFKNINPGLQNRIWISGEYPYGDYESGVLTPQEIPGSSPKAFFVEKTITRSETPGAFFLQLGGVPSRHEVVLKFNGNRFDSPGYTVIPREIPSCDYFSVVPSIFDLSQLDTTIIKVTRATPGEFYGINVYDLARKRLHAQTKVNKTDYNGNITIKMSQFLNSSSPLGRYEARLLYHGDFICRAGFELHLYIPPGVTPSPGVIPAPEEKEGIQPTECDFNNDGENDGIQTALGCIPTKDTTQFVAWILRFAIGIGGGIGFLLIIFGAIKVLTSAGNPESLKAGQELITSALIGLIFIIFSLFLLKLIGVDLLKIPGFGTP